MFVNLNVEPITEHIFKATKTSMGATVVAYPMSDNGILTHVADARQAFVSIAQCSERDNYNRKLGRAFAISRAQEGEGIALRFPKGADLETKRAMIRSFGELAAFQ